MHYNATCQHGSPLPTRGWSCTLVLSDNIMQLHESADCGRVKLIDSFSSVTLICAVDHRFKQCLLEWNEWSVYRVFHERDEDKCNLGYVSKSLYIYEYLTQCLLSL